MVTQLIYISQPTDVFSNDEIGALLNDAREHNSAHQITGFLLFDGQEFIQLIEGPAAKVDALFANIEADNRHKNVQVLIKEDGQDRVFEDWSMAYTFLDDTSAQRFGGSMSDASASAISELISSQTSATLRLISGLFDKVSNPVEALSA